MNFKKIFGYVLLVCFSFVSLAEANMGKKQDMEKKQKHNIYLGMSSMNIESSGYENAVLNDSHKHPTETGSTFIEFEDGNVSSRGAGFLFGYYHELEGGHHGPLVEFSAVFANKTGSSVVNFGYKYSFFKLGGLDIAGVGKFGLASIVTELGKIEKDSAENNGSVLPIDTEKNKFNEGDEITAFSQGYTLGMGVEVNYAFSKKLNAFFQIGYQESSFAKSKVKVGGKEVKDKKALDRGTSTILYDADSNINPFENTKSSLAGIFFHTGINFRF